MSDNDDRRVAASVPPDFEGSGTRSTPRGSDTLIRGLCAIARRTGCEIDRDALTAVMGVAWSAVAVPSQSNLAHWPMYARDAFLVAGARLFGMTIRGVHPPEAARGLPDAPEFMQHFDASYRPLVERALEHGQPVLAWRGWPGVLSSCWGEIVEESDEGIGFRGAVHAGGQDEAASADYVTLVRPPVQLYVIETISNRRPEAWETLDAAQSNARCVLENNLTDCFDVVSGPAAYKPWIERLGNPGRPTDDDVTRSGHRALAGALIRGYHSVIRFLESTDARPGARRPAIRGGPSLSAVALPCRNIVAALTEASERNAVAPVIAALREAQTATARLRSALAGW